MVGRMSLSQPEWEELVAEWRRSGKSATRFAEERGVPATALRYWINRPATRSVRPKKVAAEKRIRCLSRRVSDGGAVCHGWADVAVAARVGRARRGVATQREVR